MIEIEKLLKGQKSGEENLYDHLSNVFAKILLEHPQNAFDSFEEISHNVKRTKYKFTNPKNFDNINLIRERYSEIEQHVLSTRKLLGLKNPVPITPDQDPADIKEEEPPAGAIGNVPNLLSEMKIFEKVGLSFGEEETFYLFQSLKKFVVSKGASSVKLWGKIFGSQRDYYIVEAGVESGADDGELPPDVEKRGEGVNKASYWVSTNIYDETSWTELPIITPKQLRQSRKIRHLFTGNLDANVVTCPVFDGKEKHLLKCQIVRISFSTAINLKGMQKIADDDETKQNVENIEDYKFPDSTYLNKLENWVHNSQAILKEGRIVHAEPVVVEEGDNAPSPEELMKIKVSKDPFEVRLKELTADSPLPGLPTCWTLKVVGENLRFDTHFFDADGNQKKTQYRIVHIKSLVWPGFNFLAQNEQFLSLYVGWGMKYDSCSFFPKLDSKVLEEPEDEIEQMEPNGPKPGEQKTAGIEEVKDVSPDSAEEQFLLFS